MATNKYSVRGEADMKQHDSAIKKSASEVYKYKKQVEGAKADIKKFGNDISGLTGRVMKLNPAIGSIVSAFSRFAPNISLATGSIVILNKTIQSSDVLTDSWNSDLRVLTSSVDSFFARLSTADFSGFLLGLTKVSDAAKKVAEDLDEISTRQMFMDVSTAKFNKRKKELEQILINKNSTKEEVEAAKKELKNLYKDYAAEQRELADKAKETFKDMIREHLKGVGIEATDAWINEVFTNYGSNNSYKKQYESFQKRLRELAEKRNKIVGDNAAKSGRSNFNPNPPEAIAIDNEMRRIKNSQEYKVARVVANFSEDKIKEAQGHLINAYNAEAKLIEEQTNEMRKVQKAEGRYTKSTTSKSKEREEIEVPPKIFSEEADLIAGMYTTISEANKKILDEQLNTLPALEGHIEVNEELARLYAKENDLLEEQHELLNLQIDSISSLGSVFSNLGDTFDSTEFKAAGIITQAIATLIEGYTKAMASFAATSSPWAWIGFSVAGLATLTSVISQIHSLSGYANGGIIQGANTIGDYNLARVNSGEMILNGTQQARLFSLLNSPISGNNVSASNQVEFKIKGQDLVGIITNYNKKVGRVL